MVGIHRFLYQGDDMRRVDFLILGGDEQASDGEELQVFGVEVCDFLKTPFKDPERMVKSLPF